LTGVRWWSEHGDVRLRPLLAVAAVLLAVLTMAAAPAHAGVAAPAQQPEPAADDGGATGGEEPEDELPEPGAPDRDIIPQPNSGQSPTDAGDRGGALQIVVFLAILAGLGGIGALAVRDVRRSRARADAERL
jgi:hypothetical protein